MRPLTVAATYFFILSCLFVNGFSFIPPAAAQTPASDEMTTHETEPGFKLEVERNLVIVRAVVRDSKGKPVGNLRQEDFRIFDNGKPQTITNFSVIIPAEDAAPAATSAKSEIDPELALGNESSSPVRRRYLALYFDDVHMALEDVMQVRKAAEAYLAEALTPGDRVGIFTSSGQANLDFTDDRDKVDEKLQLLQPRPIVGREFRPCPALTPYEAYLIVSERNPFATQTAVQESLQCLYNNDETYLTSAETYALGAATRKLNLDAMESTASLRGINELLQRMAILPGLRNIALVSPGFLTLMHRSEVIAVIDRALKQNVIISSLDSKGLYAPVPFGAVSEDFVPLPGRSDLGGNKMMFEMDSRNRSEDVLEELARATGGVYFRNSNDYIEGFRRVGAMPEVFYTLAFSPRGLKFDGRFHTIKVEVPNTSSLAIEARRGYFAPRSAGDAAAQARETILQAVFSQDELSGIPVEIHTQFFKRNKLDASLSVLAKVDLHFLEFRKAEGRNLNNLTLVTALFDRDGNYLEGKEKQVDFRLLDASLAKLLESGLTTRTSFNVKPGTYLVREVVHDREGARVSGMTRTVEIPY